MPEVSIDYTSNTREFEEKTRRVDNQLTRFAENVRKDMRLVGDVTKLATQGLQYLGQAFDLAEKQAHKLGRVDVASNIQEMQEAGEGLLDVLVQIPVGGRDFLQWMGDAAEGAANLAKLVGAASIQFQLSTGMIDQQTAELQLNAMLTDENAEAAKELAAEKESLTATTKAQETAEKRLQQVMVDTKGYKASEKAANDAERSIADLSTEIRRLRSEQGKAIYTERELEDLSLDLRDATIDEEEAMRRKWEAEQALLHNQEQWRTEELTRDVERQTIAHERSRNALDDARTALENAKNATVDNAGAIAELNDRLREETDRWREAQEAALAYANALGNVAEAERIRFETGDLSRVVSGGGPSRRAHGGPFGPGDAVIINENPSTRPEVVMANAGGGGKVLTRQQAGVGATVNIGTVVLSNGMDTAAFAAMLKRELSYQ